MRNLVLHVLTGALAMASVEPANAATLTYTAVLDGASEDPPVTTPGSGTATVVLDTTANTMRVQASFADLIGAVTVAHIHGPTAAPFFGNAGVMTPTPSFPGFPAGVTSGTYDATFDLTSAASFNAGFLAANGGTPDGAQTALAAALSGRLAYLNIHTSYAASGEIRGFLVPAVVPIPPAFGLLAAALAGLGAAGLCGRSCAAPASFRTAPAASGRAAAA